MDSETLARLTAWRRHLHTHPGLTLHEEETAAFVSERLTEMGIPHQRGVGKNGIVATIARGGSNRAVGLRADMDALPITEATGLPHASVNQGVMHACGHDGHTTSLLGAAMLLLADPAWSGTVHLVFQPAEEGGGGAKAMIADGLFQRFPMERIFGYHNWPGLAAGTVAVHDGPVMAAGARLSFVIEGQAGHAALPHLTRDPIVAAGHLIVALQSIIARNIDPLDSAVITMGMIQGGSAPNQVPARVELRGTMRYYRDSVREVLEEAVRRTAAGIGTACNVAIEVLPTIGGVATINTRAEAELAAAAAQTAGLALRRDIPPAMTGEDFAWYLREKPGAFAWIGNGPDSDGRELHSPRYDFNDAVLPAASAWLATVAREALR